MRRQVLNLLYLVTLSCLVAAPPLAGSLLTFDEESEGILPAGYGGFNWSSNWVVEPDSDYMPSYSNTYGAFSSPNAVANDYGVETVTLTSIAPFTFNGAYFTTWADHDGFESYSSTSITVQGYASSVPVGSVTMALSSTGYSWLDAGFVGVDELRFLNSGGQRYWLMDNFTYDGTAAIPEPATLFLLGGGLTLFAMLKRRR